MIVAAWTTALSCIQVQFFVCMIKTPLELELLIRRPSNKTTITRACFEQFSLMQFFANCRCSFIDCEWAHTQNPHNMLEEFHFKVVWSGRPENPRARVLSSSGWAAHLNHELLSKDCRMGAMWIEICRKWIRNWSVKKHKSPKSKKCLFNYWSLHMKSSTKRGSNH